MAFQGQGTRLFTREIGVLEATVRLVSNNPSLIYDRSYFEDYTICSQWANLAIRDVEPHRAGDGYFYIFDHAGSPASISLSPEIVTAIGDWTALERATSDKRYSLLGNQGVLFRFLLTILERKYGVYNFHASGLYERDTHRAYLVLGERGSGKSAVLLAALEEGRFELFATEIAHAKVTGEEVVFYRGSLRNNVRLGHLKYSFPRLADMIRFKVPEVEDPWGVKAQIGLERFGVHEERLVAPELIIVIPRIEKAMDEAQVSFSTDLRGVKRNLFENITDKIASLGLIYEAVPVGSLDDEELLRARKGFVDSFISRGRVAKVVHVFAGPQNCLEGWT